MNSARSVALGLVCLALSCGAPAEAPRATPPATPSLATTTPKPAAPPPLESIVVDASIADLSAAMAAGKTSAVALVDAYIARIGDLDRRGPELHAIIELNPEARSIAEALDRERTERGVRGPLHGIPIVLKDNIGTADRMETSAGSFALVGARPKQDAPLVARLRTAGAVLLGKTNLSEWANFRSSRATSGWSARGGQTRNAYVLDRTPCGSSSGSATAVAASLAAGAIGTETDGSILCPSAMSALVGLKPTVGLVSRGGIVPIAASQDTAGPMTRTVRDTALLLNVLADDPKGVDYTKNLSDDGLRGARIGVARKTFAKHPDVVANVEAAIALLKEKGAIIVDPVDVSDHGFDKEEELMLFEFKAGMAAYLASLGDATKLRSVADLIAWNEANRDRELPLFGQELFERAVKMGPLTGDDYKQLKADLQRRAKAQIDGALRKDKLDALLSPSAGPPWVIDVVNGDNFTGASSSLPAIAGYPNINVPSGFVHELPIGISFFGTAYSETTLLRVAYAYEQASRARRPPRFLAHAP